MHDNNSIHQGYLQLSYLWNTKLNNQVIKKTLKLSKHDIEDYYIRYQPKYKSLTIPRTIILFWFGPDISIKPN